MASQSDHEVKAGRTRTGADPRILKQAGADRAPTRTPALSVVIPCYNGHDTLAVQLDALVAQVNPVPFEVILADNGSTDDSADIARSYADRLDIRVVDASAIRGPGPAANVGVAAARSDRIAFCDADDEVALDWVRAAYTALDEHQFVAGRVDIEKLNPAAIRRSRVMAQQDGLQDSAVGVGLKHAGAGNMAFHREIFEAVGGFDEALLCLQDSDLCWRIQLAGTPLDYVPEMIIHTRLRSTLRSMAKQGFQYGKSFAQLEGRYSTGDPAETAPAPVQHTSRLTGLRRRVRQAVAGGLGGSVWQAGWRVGHRLGKRGISRHPAVPQQRTST